LRLLEAKETKLNTLRHLLSEGEESGIAEYDINSFLNELDDEPNL
jgi:antitoxin ParD1/3/4